MSKRDQDKVNLPTDGSVQKALATARSEPKGPLCWVVIGYSNPTTLCVLAEGDGGLAEASANFPNDEACYCLLRKDLKVEMAKTVKFAFLDWTPNGMKPLRKALISTHKGQVMNMMKPFHVNHSASDKSDLDEKMIESMIAATAGTASHVTEKRENKTKETPKPEPVVVSAPAPKKNITPIGAQRVSISSNESKTNPALKAAGSASIGFVDEEAFRQAMRTFRNDKENQDWILVSYAKKDTLSLIGTGSGGIDELLTRVEEDNVNFGLVRVIDIIDKSRTVKFMYIKWQPESVKPMKKAEIGTRKGAIDAIFAPYHVDIHASQKKDVNQEIIMNLVMSASGSKSNVIGK